MTTPSFDEAALIERASGGDRSAFTTLVAAHSERVYRTLRGFGLDQDEAEDAAQDVFIRAWRGLQRFQARSQLSTWLYRISFNEAQRRVSRRSSAPVSVDASDPDLVLDAPDREHSGPEAQSLEREFVAKLREALAQLPLEWRTAVVLRDLEGLSTEEAATVLGIRQAAFKSRLHRGRMRLRVLLEPYIEVELP
jgi:RNA polymerase sigma-70 factor (ECF subfamily)